jgi:S-adenosyl-L-methionine hydrolase (adenosine-forming)
MQLVSLITDYGHKDHYSAELKAALYTKCENINIIDITNEVEVFDIALAAYELKYMLPSLPANSINIISVNNYYEKKPKYIVFTRDDKYFIGPDNGAFSLVFDDVNEVFEIDTEVLENKQVHNVYAHAVACIHHGLAFEEFANPLKEINIRLNFRPVVTNHQIKATIIHIDQYDNVVTNCTKEIFDKSREGRAFSIYFKPNDPIEMLSKHYGEVGIGEALAWFNNANHLEIAINMGKASSILHLFKNETIQIDFH